jgi:Lrp/AsnC family leucine-responsive transcriptional regulator
LEEALFMALDDRDRIILEELQKDSDRTNVEIADVVRVSPAAYSARKKRLKDEGYIKKVNAVLDHSQFELNATGFILIKLIKQGREANDRAIAAAENIPNVLEVHALLGQYDILVKVRAKNNAQLLGIAETIGAQAEVTTETVVVARTTIETTSINVRNNNNNKKKGGAP